MTKTEEPPQLGDDPIVAEVRRVRESLFAQSGHDLEKFAQRLRQEQAQSGRQIVSRPPRTPKARGGEAA
jgi:hypothetical protein